MSEPDWSHWSRDQLIGQIRHLRKMMIALRGTDETTEHRPLADLWNIVSENRNGAYNGTAAQILVQLHAEKARDDLAAQSAADGWLGIPGIPEKTVAPKKAYHETHESPHCPTCTCEPLPEHVLRAADPRTAP